MKPVVTVFFDGLKPDSLAHMPFLHSLPHQRRLQTILGYSIACHASMYSGVYPDRHGMWFLWQVTPESSPFACLSGARLLSLVDCLPTRLLVHKVLARTYKSTAYWGLPRIVNLPIKYWPLIDVTEKRFWDEPGYLPGYPTVFDLLRSHRVPFDVVGMTRSTLSSSEIVAAHRFEEIKPWTYLFIGDVDELSHHYGQESRESIARLQQFDALVERRYREFEARVGDFDFFVFSDHGHIPVREKINLYELFHQAGDDLNDYMHLIDANFARFWFSNEAQRSRVERVLARIENGFVLSAADMREHRVALPDCRFGELIYYLDAGSIFSWTTFGYGTRQQSMHGYLPRHRESDGVFLSNRAIGATGPVTLVDILPSLLALLGLPVPLHVEGRAIWA